MSREAEVKTCQNCKKDFTIEPDDFAFYEKMKVPAPHHSRKCPNEFETSYAPDRPEIVYCEQCYQQKVA